MTATKFVVAIVLFAGFAAAAEEMMLSDVSCSTPVTYTVVNNCTWNSMRFPRDYPENAHFSPLCGTAHGPEVSLLKVGELASEGVRLVAEMGECNTLLGEVTDCRKAGSCNGYQQYDCSVFSGTCAHTGNIAMSDHTTYVSMVTMVAPSPDWMVGLDSANLCKENRWMVEYSRDMNAYDAGTDAGETFLSDNKPEPNRLPISKFDAKDESNIFYNVEKNMLYPICKISFTLNM